MRILVCLDDKNGMLFNRRRQSQDRLVRQRMAELTAGGVLRLSPYSARQFEPGTIPNALICEDFLTQAKPGDWCFVEDRSLGPYEDRIETLVVFRWNRVYPADLRLDIPLDRWTLTETEKFPGHSHKTITMEVYRK